MSHVNYWLLALSFVLGLLLTLAFMIRRVKREVPIYAGGAAKLASTGTAKPRATAESESKTEVISKSAVAGAAGLAGGAALAGAGKKGDAEDDSDADAKSGYSESKTEVLRTPAAEAGLAGAAGLAGGAALAGAGKKGDADADGDAESDAKSGYSESKTEVLRTPAAEAGLAGAAGLAGGAALAGAGKKGDAEEESESGATSGYSESKTESIAIPAAAAGAAGLAGGAALAAAGKASGGAEGEEPYGAGSFRGAAVPSGWTIKGNEDSMLYHTTDSPSYKQTIAEVWFRDEPTAEKAGFTRWDKGRAHGGGGIAALADVPAGKFGAGSATPGAGGSGPEGWTIKGNEDSMLYHTTDSPSYGRTIAEVWFFDEDTARKAGFRHWKEGRAKTGGSGIAALADVPAGKFGAGSATPGAGGSGPEGWTIKGNEDSMLYHTTDSPSYKRTIAEVWFFDEDTARNAGFRHWKEGRAKNGGAAKLADTEPEVPPGKFGPGSATPGPGGSGPDGWTVKGNEDSMLYHTPESSAYNVTVAEIWFRDVATAEAAGFNRWDSGKSQRGKH